ncbi:MAG: zinc-binding dehydrogenase [Gemmatimonadales bacterium]|nr:zinc-binding dehydrogenase [Gemmatimonadales bacterium]
MRALTLASLGGPDALAVRDVPAPALSAATDVRIAVHAAAINRLDLFVTHGLPGITLEFPHIVGTDAAGVVESVGPAVRHVRPGDRVIVNPGISCGACAACAAGDQPLCNKFGVLGEHRPGTAAELLVVPAVNVAPMPDRMSWAQAAAFSLATLTAWRMLITRAALRAGETVLVWGAGGGVAQAAMQVARLTGGEVIVASGSDAKLDLARRLGAHHTINHATGDAAAEVKRITGRRGAQVVVDSVGEATWPLSLRCLARGGRLVTCGATTGPMVGLDVRKLFWHQWSILGSTMGSHSEYAAVVALAARGELWPIVDQIVPLERGAEAFRRLARGEQAGKLVLEVTA